MKKIGKGFCVLIEGYKNKKTLREVKYMNHIKVLGELHM